MKYCFCFTFMGGFYSRIECEREQLSAYISGWEWCRLAARKTKLGVIKLPVRVRGLEKCGRPLPIMPNPIWLMRSNQTENNHLPPQHITLLRKKYSQWRPCLCCSIYEYVWKYIWRIIYFYWWFLVAIIVLKFNNMVVNNVGSGRD